MPLNIFLHFLNFANIVVQWTLLIRALDYQAGDRRFESRFRLAISGAPPVHQRNQRLDEGQPTVTEPNQESDHVVGHQSAARQDHHQRRATAVDQRITVVDAPRNLGVIIDSQLCLDAHVAALCRSG